MGGMAIDCDRVAADPALVAMLIAITALGAREVAALTIDPISPGAMLLPSPLPDALLGIGERRSAHS